MVRSTEQIIADLKEQFSFVKSDDRILAVILYGSVAEGEHHDKSDIDVCIVTGAPKKSLYSKFSYVMGKITGDQAKLDIRFFEELPLLIRGDIMENGKIIYTRDMGDLTEYFFFSTRKELEDYRYRLQYI